MPRKEQTESHRKIVASPAEQAGIHFVRMTTLPLRLGIYEEAVEQGSDVVH